ncbi:pca operon transcription factor PcaQ [Pelagibacterium halotolerans]|uniref:pca operon transcription factor PcaQ n=1 Tax=Pelagibacterium halotolerans TaxID=531813 RepID=UPI00384AB4B3
MVASLIDPRIKLRHVACFLEINRQGGVVGAGAALGLSQPAVSKAVTELEDILGVALFDRSRRKLALTGFGEMFLRYATTSVAALREGIESVANAQTRAAVVRLGALPTVEVEVVPRAVLRFLQGPLACRVQVESGPSPHLLNLLRTGAIDFFIGRMPHTDVMTGLTFEHLYSEDLVLAARPGHPLAGTGELSLRAIERFPVLMPPPGAIIRPTVDALLVANSVGRLAQEIETVSNSFGRAYVLMSDAVWFISRSVVATDLEQGDLVALEMDMVASHGPVGITTRAGAELGVPTLAMIDAVRAEVEERG